ncbi:hypothetical protein C7974DRAFT_32329 [Boeremia exigua]|uniref:uncharacterized protein n=1 Tax=Boeremia exigua TaxID=749465 RepID=UPI001E8EB59E|nr:uncharacterized protein C7974DRAFT_32329 [Boeremia exigua]KAH6618558.1 hypothetical protein C7974DRAFT_32329 [Boeremia exigua]
MDFVSLPVELKLSIIESLEPVPTLQFALTSREHSKLSKNRLKEHEMFAKYSTITPVCNGYSIWDITKEILQDPRKGRYVRELNLIDDRPEQFEDMTPEDKAILKTAVEKLLPLYPDVRGFFVSEDAGLAAFEEAMNRYASRGFEGVIVIVLLHHLPQLRAFRYTDKHGDVCMLSFMRRVATGYQNPSLAAQMPLQHLETVGVIQTQMAESGCLLDWAVYFLCVPSLRVFAAYMMGSEPGARFHMGEGDEDEAGNEAHLRNTVGAPVSNVEELLLHGCQFDPQSFNTLLPMIKNLKTFHYTSLGYMNLDVPYEPRKVIKALSNHASHSLEEIQLAEFDHLLESVNDIPFVSAREFTKLKALRCEAKWLLPMPNDDVGDDEALSQGFYTVEEEVEQMTDPRDNLPESLEYLYLDGDYEYEQYHQLIDIFDTTNPNTPKLTLDNTCIKYGSDTSYGGAAEPEVKFAHPHQVDSTWSNALWVRHW